MYALAQALDYVYANSIVYYWQNNGPHVVNLSMNEGTGTGFSASGYAMTNQPKLATLAQPANPFWDWTRFYPGNVVVQSAGNINQDACSNTVTLHPSGSTQLSSIAYKPSAWATASNPYDGILVVGALNANGYRATPFAAAYPDVTGGPPNPGSTFGGCIDIWAPGDSIYSTWGNGNSQTFQGVQYSGNQPAFCAGGGCTHPSYAYGWANLSGTSMAAPHVAAAAAWYIDQANGQITPSQVEQMLRNTATGASGNPSLPSGLNMVQLQ